MGGLAALFDWEGVVCADAFLKAAECDSHRGEGLRWSDSGGAVIARSWKWESCPLWVANGVVCAVHGVVEGTAGVLTAEHVVEGFLRTGMDFLVGLEGEHSFVLWESKTRRLYLSRGSFGVKPLFYRVKDAAVAVATGVETLLRWAGEEPRFSFSRLSKDLGYPDAGPVGNPAPSETVFAGISRVLPGRIEIFQSSQVRTVVDAYKVPRCIEDSHTVDSAGLEMRRRLADVMIRRPWNRSLISMSGGMDSTALAAVASRDSAVRGKFSVGGAVHAVTLVGSDELALERTRARIAAADLGLSHHEVDGDTLGVAEVLQRLAVECDQPYLLGGGLVFRVLEFARERGYTEIVLGHGGDEFWRYRRPPRHQSVRRVGRMVLALARRALDGTAGPGEEEKDSGEPHESAILENRRRFLDRLLAGPVFENVDQLFARYGINASFPYYDQSLANLAFSIRPEIHGFDGSSKAVLRRAMRGYISDSFLESWAPIRHNNGWLRAVRREQHELPVDFRLSDAGDRSDDGMLLGSLLDRHWRLATILEWSARSRLSPRSISGAGWPIAKQAERKTHLSGHEDG